VDEEYLAINVTNTGYRTVLPSISPPVRSAWAP
jgi:hypothetical protein